jgi:phosphopantothenoylcysteine decarboxylase/phosphopantothenate--cysteine ligase
LRIVLGVTGGIAAYKATAIIRQLTEAGHDVQVIPTENALRFIGATTLEALSHHTVDTDLYTDVAEVKHVEIGQNADLIIVAPATASFLARCAAGIADDLLGTTLLASKAPVLIAPAMHTEMWQNASTVANVATLRSRGIAVLDPAVGRLTGQDSGPGRLPEAEEIIAAAFALMRVQDLAGRKVMVTAGGTQEAIDPVRFIGNHSSGKQGIAIARAAKSRGAKVCLVACNLNGFGVEDAFDEYVSVVTAAELEQAVNSRLATCDVLVMAAAVSDYRVAEAAPTKLKRSELGDEITLRLLANPDILKNAVSRISTEQLSTLTVGFAAETAGDPGELLRLGRLKIAAKGCDLLVANDVSGGEIFDKNDSRVIILNRSGTTADFAGTKEFVGERVLDAVVSALRP